MGFQPDYVTEANIYARHIIENVKDPKIAVLMQNDDAGRDYLNGFKKGLGPENEKLIVQLSTFEVTDPTVDSQMIQLKNSGANVFFNIPRRSSRPKPSEKRGSLAGSRCTISLTCRLRSARS